jgi:hypothetical protein
VKGANTVTLASDGQSRKALPFCVLSPYDSFEIPFLSVIFVEDKNRFGQPPARNYRRQNER